jgi:hypothetical protein
MRPNDYAPSRNDKVTTLRLKRLATATAVAGLVTCLLSPAAGAVKKQTTAPIVLGADNLITGTTSTTTVTIPQDAAFDGKTGPNPYFRFSGGGNFVGVLLAKAGDGLTAQGTNLFVGRYGFCDTPGCTPDDLTQVLAMRNAPGGEAVLPAGDYRLYLISESPASVRIQFDGLTGKTKVVPQGRLDAEVTEPGTGISVPNNLAYSYGRTYDFKGVKGWTFKVLRIEGDMWAAGRYGSCIYRGDPVMPPQLAYSAPGCPGGLSLAEVDGTTRTSNFRIDKYSATIFDPGKWTVSSFYEAAGQIEGVDALNVVIDIPSH